MKSIRLSFLLLCLSTTAIAQTPNNTLRGKVLYQSSGNKPAVGVRVAEPDATAVFSLDNGDYLLKFQNKRNGATLVLEVGKDDGKGKQLELVNEKEVKAAKLPASAEEEPMDIIVCPAGQRDIAAQRYYRILRTTADRELERKKKEVAALLEQKEKDYQQISHLFALIDRMQAALDSAKIREQAFNIASINLDRASQMVKDAVKKIDVENDVEGALKILNAEALDTAYEHASTIKRQGEAIVKKADAGIRQVIEGYEFKISLLEPQFKYGEAAECYEKIAGIYERENYEKIQVANNFAMAGTNRGANGEYQKQLDYGLKAIAIWEKSQPIDHPDLAGLYLGLSLAYINLGEYQKALELNLKALAIYEKIMPANHSHIATSYSSIAYAYGGLGNLEKSIEFSQKSLKIWENEQPINYPNLAQAYNNLAMTYGYLGQPQKELNLHLKSLGINEEKLPANHPNLAISYNNLAYAYSQLGDHQKQLEFNLKALAIREKSLSANHPLLAASYNNLGVTYNYLGDFQKSLEFNLKALAIREKILPADHLDFVTSYLNLSGLYRKFEEYKISIEYAQKGIRIGEALTPKHRLLNRLYGTLGATYVKTRQYSEAKAALEKSESLKNGEYPLYQSWAIYYTSQKKKKQAVENLQKAVSLGFKDLKWLETEPDLKNIRKEKGYKELVEQLKKEKKD